MDPQPLPIRRLRFAYPDDFRAAWHPQKPELACAANAVSLLMPYAEPYLVRTVRSVLPQLDPNLCEEATGYVRQEASHHAQHRRFNDLVAREWAWVPRFERAIERVFGWLERRSTAFGLAFAAGFECVAYNGARWTDRHLTELFHGADPEPATLFLWHLAEEVEHKTVAFDVQRAVGGKRSTYVLGLLTALAVLAAFTVAGTLRGMASAGRLFSPVAHARLAKWAIGFWFLLAPPMIASAFAGHHPSQLADPTVLPQWLRGYDAETGTMPADTLAVLIG
ncbi:MAG TPA: metal-dependent hydrolase [Acidimicrobiales bacterium]